MSTKVVVSMGIKVGLLCKVVTSPFCSSHPKWSIMLGLALQPKGLLSILAIGGMCTWLPAKACKESRGIKKIESLHRLTFLSLQRPH